MMKIKTLFALCLVASTVFFAVRQWQKHRHPQDPSQASAAVSAPLSTSEGRPQDGSESIRDVQDLNASEKQRLAEEQKQYRLSREEIQTFAIEKAPAHEVLPYREVTEFKDDSGRLLGEAFQQ